MIYAEVIFETGTRTVACYDSEEEMLDAVRAQHDRAVTGKTGGPTGAAAERVKRIEIYDKHPNDLNVEETISTDVAKKELTGIMERLDQGGSLSLTDLAAGIRELSSPLVVDADTHESQFRMPPVKVLEKGWES